MPTCHTTTDAAAILKCHRVTVHRVATVNDIGQKRGRDLLLTVADIRQLRRLIRSKPGNPDFGKGKKS